MAGDGQWHDGMVIYDEGQLLAGGKVGPIGEATTFVSGFDGGQFSLLYVATNGNPSILEVDAAIVPLPAGGMLLLTGLGALGFAACAAAALPPEVSL